MRKQKIAAIDLGIGRRLRQAREDILELTQKGCATQLGLERTTLANYEAGRTPVRFELALRFCRQFIVSEEWLATGRFDAFHRALEERGAPGPWGWESFDKPISTRQCMDLWSDPLSRHIREGTLFSEAYTHVLARRYSELVREFTYQQVIRLSDADRWETAVNYLRAIHERHVILLNNEAKNRTHREPLYWRTYTRRIYEAASGAFGQMMSAAPEDWGKSDLPTLNESVTNQPVPTTLSSLLERLKKATEQHGRKSELAAVLGVPPQAVSMWISGAREPGGDTTLRLLEWVQAEEAKQKSGGADVRASAPPETRPRKSSDEKPRSSPKKE